MSLPLFKPGQLDVSDLMDDNLTGGQRAYLAAIYDMLAERGDKPNAAFSKESLPNVLNSPSMFDALVDKGYIKKRAFNLYSLSTSFMGSSVDHPKHYNSHPKGIECIDVIEDFSFNVGNAMKYLWRAGLKTDSPLEDLEKAIWYIQCEIKLRSD
jgi:hypothetical protein